uniref:Sorting nexin 15 n=1 Tax=Hucho hucho TaxID=62062 RepID=A0A4W5Q5C7_9TELE
MSRKKEKDEYYRFFSVTESHTYEKGHTEYKVTTRFVSKCRPEDVKEVLLYGEQLCTHKNLFGRQEFPPFPALISLVRPCRFDEGVIEERRSAAEAMLLFTTNIPALYNIPQLKDFFRVRRKKHTQRCTTQRCTAQRCTAQRCTTQRCTAQRCTAQRSKDTPTTFQPSSKGFSLSLCLLLCSITFFSRSCNFLISLFLVISYFFLFFSSPLLFYPDQPNTSHDHSELLSRPLTNPDGEEAGYLRQAANEHTAAMEREKEGEYSTAILKYKRAVDLLITGVKGEREGLRKRERGRE